MGIAKDWRRLALWLVLLGGCETPIVGPGLEPPEDNEYVNTFGSGANTSNAQTTAAPVATAPAVAANPGAAKGPSQMTSAMAQGSASGGMPGSGDNTAGNGAPDTPDVEPEAPTEPSGAATGGAPSDGMADTAMMPDPGRTDLPVCDSAEALPMRAELALLPLSAEPATGADDADDRWGPWRAAVSQFFAEPESGGLSVLVYGSALTAAGQCPAGLNPLTLPVALPQPGLNYDASLRLATASIGSRDAVAAALVQQRGRQARDPGQASALLLFTDGGPTACEGTADELASVVGTGAGSAQRVNTYMMAFGDYAASYDSVAAAGGTGSAQQVPLEPGAILDALRAVRREVRDCTFALPDMAGGFNASLMRLTLTDPAGTPGRIIGAVNDRDSCLGQEGFYFDRASAPSRIQVCPAVCEQISTGATLRTETLCPPATGE